METKKTLKEIYGNSSNYFALRKAWAKTAKRSMEGSQNLSSSDYLLYALLRGRDGRECFKTEEQFEKAYTALAEEITNYPGAYSRRFHPYAGGIEEKLFCDLIKHIFAFDIEQAWKKAREAAIERERKEKIQRQLRIQWDYRRAHDSIKAAQATIAKLEKEHGMKYLTEAI